MAKPMISMQASALGGTIRVPGDKSISHRSLMFGAVALGETVVEGLLEGEDVLATAAAMRALGAEVTREESGIWRLHGRGVGGLVEPTEVLDMGNSGTSTRLLAGLVASYPFTSFFTGDASLRARPMKRIVDPLSQMGASFLCRSKQRLPMAVTGTDTPLPITYELPVASAQVKSAILLAALNTAGETTVIEPVATRDHSETMLRHFGADLRVEADPKGGRVITIKGQPELTGRSLRVPADPSSAAFIAVAAAVTPGSDVTLLGVGTNPLRFGLFETLRDMGAEMDLLNPRDEGGEPVADIRIRHSDLRGIDVPPERAPSMIDEYPILSVAAAFASGTTRMIGLHELRVKESDRLAAMVVGLAACGIRAEEGPEDSMIVHGGGGARPPGGATIAVNLDHRIAMSFLILGMNTAEPVAVDDGAAVDTSFPGFAELMNGLGAKISAKMGEAAQ